MIERGEGEELGVRGGAGRQRETEKERASEKEESKRQTGMTLGGGSQQCEESQHAD